MPIDKIRVMISSRCKDYAMDGGGSFALSRLRKTLKAGIDGATFLGASVIECWTNETEPAKSAARDVWDECLKEVQRAHLVIALYNGDAGWSIGQSDDGICHAELGAGLRSGRDRTYLVQLPMTAQAPTERDARFRGLVEKELLFSGSPVTSVEEAVQTVYQTIAEAVSRLARGGATVLRKDSFALGEALEWSRLSFAQRKEAIEQACTAAIAERFEGEILASHPTRTVLRFNGEPVLFCVHAIPAAVSTAAAREMVGRPFLADHLSLDTGDSMHGPVHVVACHRGATEKQATDLLGFPDATVVATAFGIYVVDPVQRIQLALLANCRDQTSTRFAVQRLFDWLGRSGQRDALVGHARARARIVRAIQEELSGAGTSAKLAPTAAGKGRHRRG